MRTLIYEIDQSTGIIVTEKYQLDGKLHRDEQDGPALICRSKKGAIIREERYYWHGRLHRWNGPATRLYEGLQPTVALEKYYRNGKLHRDPKAGPAYIFYGGRDNSVVVTETYYIHGQCYRDPAEGPCMIGRFDEGGIEYEEFSDPSEAPARSRLDRKRAVRVLNL